MTIEIKITNINELTELEKTVLKLLLNEPEPKARKKKTTVEEPPVIAETLHVEKLRTSAMSHDELVAFVLEGIRNKQFTFDLVLPLLHKHGLENLNDFEKNPQLIDVFYMELTNAQIVERNT